MEEKQRRPTCTTSQPLRRLPRRSSRRYSSSPTSRKTCLRSAGYRLHLCWPRLLNLLLRRIFFLEYYRRAGGRETNLLKPLDNTSCGMVASHRAVVQANAQVAPKMKSPGGRAGNRKGEGSMARRHLAAATGCSGGVGATARCQGRAKQLEKPSASRGESNGAR